MKYENKIEKIEDNSKIVPVVRIENIFGLFETVSSEPTAEPKTFKDQIKIYKNGGTKRLYYYDTTNKSWEYLELYVPPAP